MKPSNQEYIFHLYPQFMPLREGEPGVDMLSYPFAKTSLGESILTLGHHWKGQGGTAPPCARKRDFHRAWSWGPKGMSVERQILRCSSESDHPEAKTSDLPDVTVTPYE